MGQMFLLVSCYLHFNTSCVLCTVKSNEQKQNRKQKHTTVMELHTPSSFPLFLFYFVIMARCSGYCSRSFYITQLEAMLFLSYCNPRL